MAATWILVILTFTSSTGRLEIEPKLTLHEFSSAAACNNVLAFLQAERLILRKGNPKGKRVIWQSWCQLR